MFTTLVFAGLVGWAGRYAGERAMGRSRFEQARHADVELATIEPAAWRATPPFGGRASFSARMPARQSKPNCGSDSMSVGLLDHFNIRTRKLAETVRFYEE